MKKPSEELLGDRIISPNNKQPLGGLNPYCKSFDYIGSQFLQLLINYAGLLPTHSILDVGCGTGRLAKQISKFTTAKYLGIDVNNSYIDYCKHAYPRLEFQHINIKHDEYNPTGIKMDLEIYGLFDRIAIIAVFNHLQSTDFENYIIKLRNNLNKGGVLFFTALLINSRSQEFTENKTDHPFKFTELDGEWTEYLDRPLFNTALSELKVRRILMQNNLIIREPIRYGEWSNGQTAITGHDVIIARKT